MDKKPAHIVILEEIENHFESQRQIEKATKRGEVPDIEIMTGLGSNMETGGACALLDLLPLIIIPEEELEFVLVKLSELSKKYRHCLIDDVIEKLTPTTVA